MAAKGTWGQRERQYLHIPAHVPHETAWKAGWAANARGARAVTDRLTGVRCEGAACGPAEVGEQPEGPTP